MKTSYSSFLILLSIVVGLAACRVGRNYERPPMPLPAQFNGAAPSDSSIAGMEWKKFFTDPTLQQLIDKAVSGNLDLQIAVKRVDAAQEYLKQVKVGWLPSFNGQVSAATNFPSKNSLNGMNMSQFGMGDHIEDYNVGISMSWEIDVWGKIRRQKEAALASYLQSYEGAHAVQTSVVAAVANSYFNLLMLDQQLDIARKNVALTDTIVKVIRLQKAAGEVTELAIQQAISQQQTAELLVPALEQGITIQENALRILTGELPGEVSRSSRLRDFSVPAALPAGIPAEMISRRPDVRASEMGLVAANAKVGVAQASMYPSLNITASGGLNSFKASNWFTMPASLFGTVAGSLAQPIFQKRALKTQLEVARINREQAVLEFRQSALNAIGEVSDALVKLDKLKTRQEIVARQVSTTQLAIQQAQLLFRSGMANYLEVITAQSKALESELNQANIDRERLSAMVDLYRSLGGGWK
ncbi:efflux transporter, outer membrane factor (OMF) lipoprotein, NodT family [Chitinophaga jiangningensis]|uniref:Efflux transporter, outer membrane factor (OMF) lipoprotein, NodT family n=1 Tax=Chitinophaga jiangningensis TaxID=1419482 RepID=A0A1M6YE48_9BACT|nr:efflux transporter outer membrane subunit [Chitinophaga jiangningensis]SHL16422.1 efflux transporter, outer membrane factor (OMF) lipoprotein, NodT family [Chitinophaga jiangningensis]